MLKKRIFKTKNEVEITFEHVSESHNKVELVADFNSWQPVKMVYSKKFKVFRASIRLPKNGQFQFRYLVNKVQWQNEHMADSYFNNDFGSDNSVVSTFVN